METTSLSIPEHVFGSNGEKMPLLGFGTAVSPPVGAEATKMAILQAIKLGYRHFDTAVRYGSEQPLGDAIQEALSIGLIKSRDELFITTKLWCGDAHGELVVPALKRSLQNLKLDYLDLFLIHWPVSAKPGTCGFPIKEENFLPLDFKSVWAAMEDCQQLGLTKYIGVSNFSCKKLTDLLAIAKIPPAVNQVEMSPLWQQKKLREFCKGKGIFLTGYSPLGAIGTFYGSNRVMECKVLKEIAKAKGKTVAQISLRWIYEQGVGVIVKSFNGERMKQNLEIFDWCLNEEELKMIDGITPQSRGVNGAPFTSRFGPFTTVEDIWDGEM
ncbi:Non-functional NADPH-dependent codeinone reductase 2 [Hibiscus syriacus]|uniref:Non-functional NADPH-dependent codeinone reductase 2 n=1 Tax=Hibiscus syriacus TaxID=106335 RepID=A0A6A3CSQ2_HIBSY|nr:non-functional NADPH-dependent codeinone reductase 2-like [Hibiscus syriacus]KAE8730239.1 Non-functional NADPH-dependent codeinone reductase 2 [Hibiscus syriacus]